MLHNKKKKTAKMANQIESIYHTYMAAIWWILYFNAIFLSGRDFCKEKEAILADKLRFNK